MAAKDVWHMATWAQRRRLPQTVDGRHVHYSWLGLAACDQAPTGAELTQLPSLVTCPGCRTLSVWAIASLAETSREVSIVVSHQLTAAMLYIREAFGWRSPGPPG